MSTHISKKTTRPNIMKFSVS